MLFMEKKLPFIIRIIQNAQIHRWKAPAFVKILMRVVGI
jgi:hypothetical protein